MFSLLFIIISTILLIIVYIYFRNIYNYWQKRNVKFIRPSIPFGNFTSFFLQQKSMADTFADLYRMGMDQPYIGIFIANRPVILIRDPELIRLICVKDFQYFHNRGVYLDKERDPLSGHLFALNGSEWRNLRSKLTPAFTSGKLKAMIPTLLECARPLQIYIGKISESGKPIEIREIMARYTTDIIASVAFGIDSNSIDNPDTDFRKIGRQIFKLSIKNGLRFASFLIWPEILKLLRCKLLDDNVEKFLIDVVQTSLYYREVNKVIRKDFFQLLVQLRNTGKINGDENIRADEDSVADDVEDNGDIDTIKWETTIVNNDQDKMYTINELAAQTFLFYAAGFETSSSLISFTLYELAKHPECQRQVQQEIDEKLHSNNNQIKYTTLMEMKYLTACLEEVLRLYPSVPILNRQCTKDYVLPNDNYIIEKDTPIIISILGIHHDAKYFPEPEKFIPERFYQNDGQISVAAAASAAYLPFGTGPRNCIGFRLGQLKTKIGLVLMLKDYNFHLAPNMTRKLVFSPGTFVLSTESGINLLVTKRH